MYKTKNLDLAAYLLTKGNEPKIKYLHSTCSEFSFPQDVEKLVNKFHIGDVQISLHRFLANRFMLKKQINDTGVAKGLRNPASKEYKELWNTDYWYVTSDNKVMKQVFGKAQIHTDRKNSGNYYTSETLANQSLNKHE